MIQTVVKRDGRIVGFNEEKIVTAIRKAMLHTDKGEDMQLIRQITDHISFKGEPQIYRLPKSAKRSPQGENTGYVLGDYQYQIQRHHP